MNIISFGLTNFARVLFPLTWCRPNFLIDQDFDNEVPFFEN